MTNNNLTLQLRSNRVEMYLYGSWLYFKLIFLIFWPFIIFLFLPPIFSDRVNFLVLGLTGAFFVVWFLFLSVTKIMDKTWDECNKKIQIKRQMMTDSYRESAKRQKSLLVKKAQSKINEHIISFLGKEFYISEKEGFSQIIFLLTKDEGEMLEDALKMFKQAAPILKARLKNGINMDLSYYVKNGFIYVRVKELAELNEEVIQIFLEDKCLLQTTNPYFLSNEMLENARTEITFQNTAKGDCERKIEIKLTDQFPHLMQEIIYKFDLLIFRRVATRNLKGKYSSVDNKIIIPLPKMKIKKMRGKVIVLRYNSVMGVKLLLPEPEFVR